MKKIKAIVLSLLLGFTASLTAQEVKVVNDKMENENHRIEKLNDELDLSDDQMDQLRVIFEEKREKMKSYHPNREEMEKMTDDDRKSAKIERMKWRKDMNSEVEEKISQVLSADQFQRYSEIKNDRKENRKMEWREMEHRPNKLHKRDQDKEHHHQHKEGIEHNH